MSGEPALVASQGLGEQDESVDIIASQELASQKSEKKKPAPKKKIVEIVGLKLVKGEKVGVVIFEGTSRPQQIPYSTLKHGYSKDLLAFFESHVKPRKATKDEVQALIQVDTPAEN